MQQLCFDKTLLTDARFARLMDATAWTRAEAAGMLVLLLTRTRELKVRRPARALLLTALPCTRERGEEALRSLEDAGYLTAAEDGYVVADNEAYFAAVEKMSAAGRRGGYPTHKTKAVPKKRVPKPKKSPPPSAAVWQAFESAYLHRYGIKPLRNARINAQIQQAVGRVGADVAREMMSFYLAHESSFYVRAQHSMGIFLQNLDSLYTQYQRNMPVTENDTRAQAESQRLRDQLRRIG